MKLVLASQSPRRQSILQKAGYELIVCPADFEEISGAGNRAEKVVSFNARGKCLATVKKYGDDIPVIGADTVVVIDGVIIGKPSDAQDAVNTLKKLSGRSHVVLTGIVIAYRNQVLSEVAKTEVFFKKLTDEQIADYVGTGEPLDKAGSYGIQDGAGFMVDHIEGHYDNVVGLDLVVVQDMLARLGV